MITREELDSEKDVRQNAANLLPNRWIIAVGAGLFLGLKSTGFGFEMTPIKFYQLTLEIIKYVCLSLVVVSVWMSLFRYFVGQLRGELIWFATLMIFLFSTEAFANLFLQIGKQLVVVSETHTAELEIKRNEASIASRGLKDEDNESAD